LAITQGVRLPQLGFWKQAMQAELVLGVLLQPSRQSLIDMPVQQLVRVWQLALQSMPEPPPLPPPPPPPPLATVPQAPL